jgi:hypothetical protein
MVTSFLLEWLAPHLLPTDGLFFFKLWSISAGISAAPSLQSHC